MRASLPNDKTLNQYIKLLKDLRETQHLSTENIVRNHNDFVTIENITSESAYLAQNLGHRSMLKASLIVEVLNVHNFREITNDEFLEMKEKGLDKMKYGLSASVEVTDYTKNMLLGDTEFCNSYGCDFKNTALHLCLWDQAGIPFNTMDIGKGDILHLSNVTFKFVDKDRFGIENSSRFIEAHIRGHSSFEKSLKLIHIISPLEAAFLKRREKYLKAYLFTDGSRIDPYSRVKEFPKVGINSARGEKVLRVLWSGAFYSKPKSLLKYPLYSRNISDSEEDLSPLHTRKRKYTLDTLEPGVLIRRDGSYPDGLGPCYCKGAGNPRYNNKIFPLLGKIIEYDTDNQLFWVKNGNYFISMIFEGQDGVRMPIRFTQEDALFFLDIPSYLVRRHPHIISKRLSKLRAQKENQTRWVKILVHQIPNKDNNERPDWYCKHTKLESVWWDLENDNN